MEMDLKDILRVIIKRLWLIVAICIAVGAAASYYSYSVLKPVYEASTKMIVNKTRVVEGVQELSINDLNANIQLIATYKEVIRTPWVLNDVIKTHPEFNLTVGQLIDKIQISSVPDTQIMTMTITDGDYQKAANIANAVTNEFVRRIPDIYQVNNVTILNQADINMSPSPVKPNPMTNILVAVVLALLLGIALTFLLEYLDDSLESEEEIEDYLQLPTLTVIGRIKRQDYRSKKDRWTTNSDKVGDSYAAAKS